MKKNIELAKSRMGLVISCLEMSKPRLFQQHLKEWIASLLPLETNIPLLPELHYQGQNVIDALKDAPTNPALDSLLADLSEYQTRLPQLQREIFPNQNIDPIPAENLEIFALGKNLVLRKGMNIESPEWIYQKTVRELFFYLLTLPQGSTKEQIGLVFWPDSSPAQLTCQFKNAIYRMRRSVGRDAIIYEPKTRTYAFNRKLSYYYDVDDFQSTLRKAEQVGLGPDGIEYFQQAVELYEHPYSPQLGGVWAEPIRQKLSRKYEQALLIIAENNLRKDQNQACLNICQKILSIEPCQEKAYQLSLRAYANLNDRTRMIRVFEEYKNNLSIYINIPPSESTRKLFNELLD